MGLGSGVLCFVVMQTRPCLGRIATAWVVAAERLVLRMLGKMVVQSPLSGGGMLTAWVMALEGLAV